MVLLRCIKSELKIFNKLCSLTIPRQISTLNSTQFQQNKKHSAGSADSPEWGSKKWKHQKKVSLMPSLEQLTPDVAARLAPLQDQIKTQGDKVRTMKSSGSPELDIKPEITMLKSLKKDLEKLCLEVCQVDSFDRVGMHQLASKQSLFNTAYQLYGGVAGLITFGPLGKSVLNNMIQRWQRQFLTDEGIFAISTPLTVPEDVLRASGHVDKFADYKVKDTITGACHRLDHLVKNHLEKILADGGLAARDTDTVTSLLERVNGMSVSELESTANSYFITAPGTGNELSAPFQAKLMTPLQIDGRTSYLRPELAQNIFVEFEMLAKFYENKLPFAAAEIGPVFRNEVGTKLLRMSQFTVAEIEHFCDPLDKTHPRFGEVSSVELPLYSAANQMAGQSLRRVAIGEAVREGLVANETLGYYMARIQQYLVAIGIKSSKLRFRQHMGNEMAHYACDCWDAECLTSYGWIECVGCADRSAYDLKCHSDATGVKLTVERPLDTPREEVVVVPVVNKSLIGKTFKKEAQSVQDALAKLSLNELQQLETAVGGDETYQLPGTSHVITKAMVPSVKRETRRVHVEEVTPSVIEPSFGVGRVFYALLEHTFTVREEDDKRTYFALPTLVAPVKVSVLPLSSKPEFEAYTQQLANELTAANLSVKIDDSTGSIGRRYARTDEVSIPFAVTIDFDTLKETPATVTLRERDSTQQIRMPISAVSATVQQLSTGVLQWADVANKWPKFTQQETTK